jgi:hypothetical protein
VPVRIRVSGQLLKLYHEGSNKYAGLLISPTLTRLINEFSVTLSATLSPPQSEKDQEPASISSKDCSIHIVIYGVLTERNSVGDLLSEGSLFLQHPNEYDMRADYVNPHYLLRPGARMPKIDVGTLSGGSRSTSSSREVLDDTSKSQLLQVFNSANGPNLFSEVKSSPRLRTSLQE